MSVQSQIGTPASAALFARFRTVRAETLKFTAPLSPEDMMVQSCAEASPAKWHLAHTSWFFETFILAPFAPACKAFHPDFHWLFNSYYTALGDMPAKNLRSSFSRPPLDHILAYRAHVDRAIEQLLLDLPAQHEDEILRRMALGHEHEQQHLELLLTDIKHALYTNPLHPAYLSQGAPSQTASTSEVGSLPLEAPFLPFTGGITGNRQLATENWLTPFLPFPGGITQIGISPDPSDPQAFAFDNETPRHTVFLQPFQIASRLVTAREYLAFIEDNGYTRPELWLSEGWSAMRSAGWEAPLYWQRDVKSPEEAPSGWYVYTLRGWSPLDALLDTPVCHLSYFEADAFARWKGCRLPTEFEWEHACLSNPPSASDSNMLESAALHPTPASNSPALQQTFGDVWEWTASAYTGYPGYKPLPGALGEYNGKFMSSQVILRGGSCVTPATHIRPTYRNFFAPATRWQFSGLRLAQDL